MLSGFQRACLHGETRRNLYIGLPVYVDDILRTGGVESMMWLFDALKTQYGLKTHLLEPRSQKEVKYALEPGAQVVGARDCVGMCSQAGQGALERV